MKEAKKAGRALKATKRAPRGVAADYDYEVLPIVVKAQAEAEGGEGIGLDRVYLDVIAEIEVGGDDVRLFLWRKGVTGVEQREPITLRRADLPDVLTLFGKVAAQAEKAAQAVGR